MKRCAVVIVAMASFCGSSLTQTSTNYPVSFSSSWSVSGEAIPAVAEEVVKCNSTIDYLALANRSGSSVTVTVLDESTNCNGIPCQILPGVSVAANSTYLINLGGVMATGGIQWVASDGTAIHAWAKGRK